VGARGGRGAGLALIAALLGCGGEDELDRSDELYDPTRIVEVELELEPDAWDGLRTETRSVIDVLGGDCLATPFESPFAYREATATIDGVRLEPIAVRKKGFLGSLSETKPSLKLKLDAYAAGQRHLSVDKLTLNNARQDPALLRQCLAYDRFRAAGLIAARCNFAHVVVNGEDLGIYANVEAADGDFLERRYDDPSGDLYEGTLSDFRDGFLGTFDPKTNEETADPARLEAVVDALAAPDDELLAALEATLDLDEFLGFWAMEVLVGHWDGYAGNTNNFYVYADPSDDRLRFLPWGVDGTFQARGDGLASVMATGALARRLYLHPEGRARYVARLEGLLATAWDEAAIGAELDRMAALIAPVADPDGALGLADAIDAVRGFVDGQRPAIEAELAGGPPTWTAALREPLCLETIGGFAGTFAATWGSLDDGDPFAGEATLDLTLDGDLPDVGTTGAIAGPDPDAVDKAIVQLVGALDDGTALVVYVSLPLDRVEDGTHPIDWAITSATAVRYYPDSDTTSLIGVLGEGAVELTATSTTDGEAIEGSIDAAVIDWPF
jgi:hypothetical protein